LVFCVISSDFYLVIWGSSKEVFFNIHFSELSITTIILGAIVLGVLIILPIFIWWLMEEKTRSLNHLFAEHSIRKPRFYIPMLLF